MEKKELVLDESLREVSISTIVGNIVVFSDNVKNAVLRCTGEFDIQNRQDFVSIKEKRAQSRITTVRKGIFGGVTITQKSNGNNCIMIANGTEGFISEGNDELGKKVELIIPNSLQKLMMDIRTMSGDVTLENIILSELIAETMSGNITLKNIDMLLAELNTMSGNIKASIIESIINYKVKTNTFTGRTIQESTEINSPTILTRKKELIVNTMSGDIELIFKGKNR